MNYKIFDILGPIMIGPSSSHTAGACRIARNATLIVEPGFNEVVFELHGSFAKTYQGHGTDKALLGGVMGFLPDDVRIRDSFQLADKEDFKYSFKQVDLGDVHPNTVKIVYKYPDGTENYVIGSSIGGGVINIFNFNGLALSFDGLNPTILVKYEDRRGIISYISTQLLWAEYNIESMKTLRGDNNIVTLIVELDKPVGNDLDESILNNDRFIFAKYIPPAKED